jgi:nucleobase:cation symporter-1, NCS1 family
VNQNNRNTQLTNWEIVSVNPNDKKWNWFDLFCFWGVSLQSIIGFSLITSLYLVYELNFLVVLFGSLIAFFLIYFLVNLIGKPSQKHGIPFPVFLRLSMGINGAKYISILRGFVGIFMFGVQSYFISKSFGYLIRMSLFSLDKTLLDQDIFLIFFFSLNIIDWVSFLFAILLQLFLFSKSHAYNKLFIKFSALAVYIGMILFLILIFSENFDYVLESFKDILIFNNFFTKENIAPMFTVAGTIFAYFSIIIMNFGDFSRYVKNESELKKGNLSLLLNLIIFSFFAVIIVIGSDIILNKNLENMERILTSPTDIIGKFDNIFLSIVVLFFILFASASTNLIANYIPTQNSLLNFKPNKLNLKSSAYLIGFIGFLIGISWVPFLSQIGILSFVDTISSFFGPIFGIMVVDYYLIKNKNIINKDIFSASTQGEYFFSNGWHLKAIYSLFIGFIFAAATIWNSDLRFLQSYSWLLGALMSSLTYYLLASK